MTNVYFLKRNEGVKGQEEELINNGCTKRQMGFMKSREIYAVLNAPLSLKRNARSKINNKPKKGPLRAD